MAAIEAFSLGESTVVHSCVSGAIAVAALEYDEAKALLRNASAADLNRGSSARNPEHTAALSLWRSAGIFSPATPASSPAQYQASTGSPSLHVEFQGRSVTIRCEDSDLYVQLKALLAPLCSPPSSSDEVVEVCKQDGRLAIVHNTLPVWELCDFDMARHLTLREVLECLHGRANVSAVLHASAVGSGDSAILAAGNSGSGKTTLARKLIDAGCAYVADDLVALNTDGRRVFPFPVQLSVKATSPDWGLGRSAGDNWTEYRWPPERTIRPGTVSVDAIVFPSFGVQNSNHCEPISPEECLARLVRSGTRITSTCKSIRPLAELANRTPAYSLQYRDSDYAVNRCLRLLQSAEQRK